MTRMDPSGALLPIDTASDGTLKPLNSNAAVEWQHRAKWLNSPFLRDARRETRNGHAKQKVAKAQLQLVKHQSDIQQNRDAEAEILYQTQA